MPIPPMEYKMFMSDTPGEYTLNPGEYTVQRILDVKYDDKFYYKVLWSHTSQHTWEPEENLISDGCFNVEVLKFWKNHIAKTRWC